MSRGGAGGGVWRKKWITTDVTLLYIDINSQIKFTNKIIHLWENYLTESPKISPGKGQFKKQKQ